MTLQDFLEVCHMPRIKVILNVMDEPSMSDQIAFNFGCEKGGANQILRSEILESEVTNITIANGLLAITTQMVLKGTNEN